MHALLGKLVGAGALSYHEVVDHANAFTKAIRAGEHEAIPARFIAANQFGQGTPATGGIYACVGGPGVGKTTEQSLRPSHNMQARETSQCC